MAEKRRMNRKRPENTGQATPQQDVTYIPPAPVNRKQVILVMASIVAVAVAIFLGLSIFFKVDADQFRVHGNQMYSADTIWKATGLKDGDNLLSFGKAKVASRIMQQLPYVKSVRIQISLPDTVNIYVEELDVYLSVQDEDGGWWFISAEGKVLEKTNKLEADKHTVLTGVSLYSPVVGQQVTAAQHSQDPMHSDANRLDAGLEIALALENNEILGSVAGIDVTRLNDITFKYEDRLIVKLGEREKMSDKILYVSTTIVEKIGQRDTGILHVSTDNGIQIEFERRKIE